ncbi:MAG: hypothetical protein ACI32C_02770 [Candidatus Enteromonas sp.]
MKAKFISLILKVGLVLLLMNLIMLFFVQQGSAEWVITWISIALVGGLDMALIIYENVKAYKEKKHEE